jgi:hypothetical protein
MSLDGKQMSCYWPQSTDSYETPMNSTALSPGIALHLYRTQHAPFEQA